MAARCWVSGAEGVFFPIDEIRMLDAAAEWRTAPVA